MPAGVLTATAKPGALDRGLGFYLLAFTDAVLVLAVAAAPSPLLAFLFDDGFGRTVLPLCRISAARGAIEGDPSEQLCGLAGEAGVRQAL